MKRSRCKRAMCYREQEEPARLECPECGAFAASTHDHLEEAHLPALTDCHRFPNSSQSRRSSSSGGDHSGPRCGRGGEFSLGSPMLCTNGRGPPGRAPGINPGAAGRVTLGAKVALTHHRARRGAGSLTGIGGCSRFSRHPRNTGPPHPSLRAAPGSRSPAVPRRGSCQTPRQAVPSTDNPRNRPAKERRRRTARRRRARSRPLPASPRVRRSDDRLGCGGRHRPSCPLPASAPTTGWHTCAVMVAL
jgi:hypothetical protein